MSENLVWYASYGSNILLERFMCYIEGKSFRGNPAKAPCTDKTPPRQSKPLIIPHNMYFAKSSPSWDGKGVAFLNDQHEGMALGRMYLITQEQFEEINEREGLCWYGKPVDLGECDGYPIKTFTNHDILTENKPSQKYLDVIKLGILETYPLLKELNVIQSNSFETEILNQQAHGMYPFKITVEQTKKDEFNEIVVKRINYKFIENKINKDEDILTKSIWKD